MQSAGKGYVRSFELSGVMKEHITYDIRRRERAGCMAHEMPEITRAALTDRIPGLTEKSGRSRYEIKPTGKGSL